MQSSIASGLRRFRSAILAFSLVLAAGAVSDILSPDRAAGPSVALPGIGSAQAQVKVPQTEARKVQAVVEQANKQLQDNKADQALKTLDDGLKQSPRDARLRFLFGVTLNRLERNNEAIDVFQQLTEDYPELPEPYNNLAVLYAGRGDLDQAKAALERALRALPNYALAQENLGDVYLRLAARAYEQAGKLNPRGDGTRKLTMSRELLAKVTAPVPTTGRRSTTSSLTPPPVETPTPVPFPMQEPDPFRTN